MTKKLKFLAFALIAVLTCVGFASCGDDNDEPKLPSDLIGSVWKGVNDKTNYPTEVKVESATTCVITVYEPNSTTIYDQARCLYLYSETTGAFSVEYDDWNVKGYIKGDKMTLTDNRYGNFTLTRVK